MSTAIPYSLPDIRQDLIKKYTLRGPRYTSYPTAPEWTPAVGPEIYLRHIEETNSNETQKPLSLYFHIPFCRRRCYYCACNVIITPRDDVTDHYVDLLTQEMKLITTGILDGRRVIQLHLGGGTPTTLPPAQLHRLLANVERYFSISSDAERSVEVDVRVTTPEHLDVLRSFRFNRISFGVQDFSPFVQRAIGRTQTIEETARFTRICREMGFDSINIDLVCGLPYQTVGGFQLTLKAILDIDPDRIAFYNYAYLPSKMPYQRRIDPSTLPDSDRRFAVFRSAIERLTSSGYAYIGMDHFAKYHDELTVAQNKGTLQRNFMGFTTRAGTDLYAFGVSSISSLTRLYVQNTKNLRKYEQMLDEDIPPVERGIELDRDDQIRRWVIMQLMCNLRVNVHRFKDLWQEDFHSYFRNEIPRLEPFIEDGLIEPDIGDEIRLTRLGQIIVRPVVMTFDRYLAQRADSPGQKPLFSQTL